MSVIAHNLRLLGVLEYRFAYNGEPAHEIVFVFDSRADPLLPESVVTEADA